MFVKGVQHSWICVLVFCCCPVGSVTVVFVSGLCVPTYKLSVFVLKLLQIDVVITLLFDTVHFLVLM